MSQGFDHPLNEPEISFHSRLVTDFATELSCLSNGFDLLKQYGSYLVDNEETFQKPDLLTNLKSAETKVRCKSSWTILMLEFVERLSVGELLLKLGHQSRALASARDSFECLQWAEICLHEPTQALRWLNGKKVQRPKGFSYPPQISKELEGNIQNVLSVWGTHPYIESCLLTNYPAAHLAAVQPNDTNAFEIYILLSRRTLTALLYILGSGIEYVKNAEPSLLGVSDPHDTLKEISDIVNDLVSKI